MIFRNIKAAVIHTLKLCEVRIEFKEANLFFSRPFSKKINVKNLLRESSKDSALNSGASFNPSKPGYPVSIETAQQVDRNSGLKSVSEQNSVELRKLLARKGFKKREIQDVLLSVPFDKLKALPDNCADRVTEFSQLLGCSIVEGCQLYSKYRFLRKFRLETLKSKIDLIKDGGISQEELAKDLCVLTYTASKLSSRLALVRELDLAPIKPWMLRCSEQILQRTWNIREANRVALGNHADSFDYLRARLNLSSSDKDIETLGAKHPPVLKVQVSKLKTAIDFLLSEGFTPSQIRDKPRVLCHSVLTIQNRLFALREKHFEPINLSVLCKNRRSFNDFLKKLELLKNKEKQL